MGEDGRQVIVLHCMHFCKLFYHTETEIEYFPPEMVHLITLAFVCRYLDEISDWGSTSQEL